MWSFLGLNAVLIAGHDWRLLGIMDGAAVSLLALGLVAARIWPDKIWIRGTR